MAIHSNAGSRLFISPTSVNTDEIEALSDEAAVSLFEGISDWVEVEEVENLGEIGDTSEVIPFASIGDKRVRKLKGQKDAGTMSLIVGRDPLDDGQQALIDAEKTDFDYVFKVEMNDARTAEYTNSVLYFAGKVMSRATNFGDVSSVVRRNFDIGVNTALYEVVSELTSP